MISQTQILKINMLKKANQYLDKLLFIQKHENCQIQYSQWIKLIKMYENILKQSKQHSKSNISKGKVPISSLIFNCNITCTIAMLFINLSNNQSIDSNQQEISFIMQIYQQYKFDQINQFPFLNISELKLNQAQKSIRQILQSTKIITKKQKDSLIITYCRIFSNLIINKLLQRKYSEVRQIFQKLVKILNLQQIQYNKECKNILEQKIIYIEFIFQCWFKNNKMCMYLDFFKNINFDQKIIKALINKQISIQQIINSNVNFQNLKKIFFNISTLKLNQNLQFFKKFNEIMKQFEKILKNLKQIQNNSLMKISYQKKLTPLNNINLFKLILKIQKRRILQNQFLSQNEKTFILKNLQPMKNQQNSRIINQMLKLDFANKIIKQIKINFEKFQKINSQRKIFTQFFQKIINKFKSKEQKDQNNQNNIVERIPLAEKKINKNSQSIKFINIQCFSERKNRRNITKLQSHLDNLDTLNFSSISQNFQNKNYEFLIKRQRKINKMIKFCEYGTFLNKRNFNSDGGQFKFIKSSSNCLKWGKNPQKVQCSPQIYPLKDIKYIVYGKIAPNLQKESNKILKQQFCFSLVLQKRTLDFYCKDYNEVQNWVCGMTAILKKNNCNFTGYTPGKLRWRNMFSILRQAFIQPLKSHQRNRYYFQNAYSLIRFKENGYKLPSKNN